MNEGKLTIKEQMDNLRDAIRRAMVRGDSAEIERLEGHLEELNNQIKEKK